MSFLVTASAAFTVSVNGEGLKVMEESLPALVQNAPPKNFEELWAGYDPRREPLDVEVIKEWEKNGVVLKIVRYRIGIFKGQRAMMAAVYGYPKGGENLPALVQIHGGGQSASENAVLTNAKRGYATVSLAWAGRISASNYNVWSDDVKRFWTDATDDPKYLLTTDWGALDAYHAPTRNPKNEFGKIAPADWTLDAVESPRNSPWFLCALGARRALTFLEAQPEVDADRLGVYGHSMGGKITVMTAAADSRVKAAAPSCGGISDRPGNQPLYGASIADGASLSRVTCPIIFLSPANDFHGQVDDLIHAVKEIKSNEWRISSSPHHNHQDTPEYEVATQLWMDQFLKGTFQYPQTPVTKLDLGTKSGTPTFSVQADPLKPILSVDVFYAASLAESEEKQAARYRFWHYAPTTEKGGIWTANLPLTTTDKPLWVYANVVYKLDQPITGAGYYYRNYTADRFVVSSVVQKVGVDELRSSGAKVTLQPSTIIETFDGDWEKEWFTYKPEEWALTTRKLHDDHRKAPAGARLALRVRSERPNQLVVRVDDYAAEVALTGGPDWQSVSLTAADFTNSADEPMANWEGIRELTLSPKERLSAKKDGTDGSRERGRDWQGEKPEFHNLRWEPDVSAE